MLTSCRAACAGGEPPLWKDPSLDATEVSEGGVDGSENVVDGGVTGNDERRVSCGGGGGGGGT